MVQLQKNASLRWRLIALLAFFFLFGAAIAARVFTLAIIYHKTYAELAVRQNQFSEILPSRRGNIFFQDKFGTFVPAAFDQPENTIAVSPKLIKDPQTFAKKLSAIINVPQEKILAAFGNLNDPYEILMKNVPDDIALKIQNAKLNGIFLTPQTKRTYPNAVFASSVLGFTSTATTSQKGLYGIERQYDSVLEGETGFFEGQKDASGFWVALGKRIVNPPRDGSNIVLTIDYNIQMKAESELEALIKKWSAESGSLAIMDPATGKMLALASSPSFDPNAYGKEKNYGVFQNPIVESRFELGSVVKPLTMAAGINEHIITKDTTYVDKGELKFGSYTISNFDNKAHGTQTMTQVLEQSLNTGAVFVEQLLGKEKFKQYFTAYGLDERTGVDLPSEVSGDMNNLRSGRDINYATASFGQGIALSPIALLDAIAAFANGGIMMKPYAVEKIIDGSGNEILTKPETRRSIVSKETADTITQMLVSAVRNGAESKAGVKGYFIAGKTGTAQVPNHKTGGYYADRVIHTFVGWGPAFRPKFFIYIQLNRPQGVRFSSSSISPAFHNLAEFILNYYEIPPDEK
ncbi:penicillin-binding protein 2 [Patescibacteria group bacterium]|nr:penicillin-binding protein 2 [Patescibacteria group bacterium]